MSGSWRLDISIGPVQGFVVQSRRTRDLWGSSYLLSYLAAQAARGVEEASGSLIQPRLAGDSGVKADPLFAWVRAEAAGEAKGERPPHIGSVPNHFVAKVEDAAKGRQAAEAAITALQGAWRRVCQAVWDRYVAEAAPLGVDVAAIWQRQTEEYWEVTWTLAPLDDKGAALARRKLWRTHRLPDEPGDKCMVMPDLQELSGYIRARGERQRELQDQFWEAVRKKAGILNLRVGDRLSAVALVKRLFVDVGEEAIGGRLDTSRWPSTIDIAAAPWVERVLAYAPEQARAYAQAIRDVAPKGAFSSRPPIDLEIPPGVDTDGFERLDANYLQRMWIQDERQCVLEEDNLEIRKRLADGLKAIARARDERGRKLGAAPIFYALLAADGDRLGELLEDLGSDTVSAGLSRFTARVPEIVQTHKGVVVYAGGDDVLAMLPVPTALACARELREAYGEAFAGEKSATLSASVLFAHGRVPLNAALGELRRLLDNVAKDANGRDSLAVGILKGGGLNAEWVTTWRRPRFADEEACDAVAVLESLADRLDLHAEERLSSSLLYRIREILGLLCEWHDWSPGSWGVLPKRLDLRTFLRAEVMSSLTHIANDEGKARERAEALLGTILAVMGRSRRTVSRKERGAKTAGTAGEVERARSEVAVTQERGVEVGVDALLIARFLANRGVEEGDE